jgi:hypothetical protein
MFVDWCFDDEGFLAKPRMVEDAAKPFYSNIAVSGR